ncbi:MAG: SH3 domain-containing protein [Anaerolineae bacterium]|nr:SH3 domain-containing protein [Anaerolineae bacterium]
MKKGLFFHVILLGLLLLTSCSTDANSEDVPPTLTLAPNVSRTPRFTATPIPSRTPLPSATFTPSETVIPPTPSDTPMPTATPPITGSVNSLQSINVREGPGVSFGAIVALRPATRVEILGRNNDGTWLNIRMEDGSEGWVLANLIRIQPTATPFPTLTSSPDLTAMALGTTLPTALFGGGTITPTPPRSIAEGATPTPVQENANAATVEGLQLPNLEAINQTATALAGGGLIPQVTTQSGAQPTSDLPLGGPTGGPIVSPQPTLSPVPGSISTQQGADVLAYCDDRSFGSPPPTNLAAGSTVDVFWIWFAATRQQILDHLDAATYTVTLDGETLDYRQFQGSIRQSGGQYMVDWYVRTEPLASGPHTITYRLTWSTAISDGAQSFGPGTSIPEETGSCTFNVR